MSQILAAPVAIATVSGVIIGPFLAAWSLRAVSSVPIFAAGWWKGGESRPGRIVASAAVTAAALAVVAMRFAGTAALIAFAWFAAVGVVLAVIDINRNRIPRSVVRVLVAGGVVLLTLASAQAHQVDRLISAAEAAAVVFVATTLLTLVAPNGFGAGDSTLLAATALWTGWLGWPSVMLALAFGVLVNLAIALALVAVRCAGVRDRFAAGPGYLLGALAAMLLAG